MNSEAFDRLREKLRCRAEALREAEVEEFYILLHRFLAFVGKDDTLAAIVGELVGRNPQARATADIVDSRSPAEIRETKTYELAAAVGYHVLVKIAKAGSTVTDWPGGFAKWGILLPVMFRAVKHWWVRPFTDYLEEKLDEQAAVIGLLLRYKKRCEWFNREALTEAAATEDQKDYAQVEGVLKKDLYRYLHDQGVNLIIEPASVRGEIDVIIDDQEGRRAYTEGKVFDNDNRNKAYIRKGFGQLLVYMAQYNAATSYLVIYKTCKEMLSVAGDGDILTIPFVRHNGKTVFVIIIDLGPLDKAASQQSVKHITLTRDDLVQVVGDGSA
jgi:hypothetical protein